jgi:hypothetical protein
MINSDRRHHRLASSRYTKTEERLVRSLQPLLKRASPLKDIGS